MSPSIHDLHTALWSSFLGSAGGAGFPPERKPMPPEKALSVLLELLKPENVNILNIVPRPLLGVAAWNLLPQYLRRPDRYELQPLLVNVIGMTLDEVAAIYSQSTDPLLVLARQYNVLDYRWQWLSEEQQTEEVDAMLQLCVQTELDALKPVAFPDCWPTYGWLWGPVELAEGRNEPQWLKYDSGKERLTAQIKLPGGPGESRVAVSVEVQFHITPLDVTSECFVEGEMFETCKAWFKIEKMRGRPGATRISHRKKVAFGDLVPEGSRRDILRYWLQTETLRLVLPS